MVAVDVVDVDDSRDAEAGGGTVTCVEAIVWDA